jgi:hypothetical protein
MLENKQNFGPKIKGMKERHSIVKFLLVDYGFLP